MANRLLQGLGEDRGRFAITALRPPTFEQLQKTLTDAKEAGRPYHIVHFDGHGIYADLTTTTLAAWLSGLSNLTLGGATAGKHGYLLFEHASEDKMRPVDGQTLGQLLHDNGVPVLVLNACQSAMHEAAAAPKTAGLPAEAGVPVGRCVHDEIRAIGSLAQAVIDQGIPAVLGMRYVPEEGFVGRDETILALDRAFDHDRVVLLHAYAGQGKSSTAVEFARWYALTGWLGPQPLVFLASFESHTDFNGLLEQIGQPLARRLRDPAVDWTVINDPASGAGILPAGRQDACPTLARQASENGDNRLAVVKRILRQFPVLWIWDNVEPVAGFPQGTESQWTAAEQSDLRNFLKQFKLDPASRARVLLTLRRDEKGWLGGIPYHIAMPRMRNPDAAKLALKLGEDKKLKPSEIADWQPLLDYCAGNPLTLRVLAGQAIRKGLRGKKPIEDFVEAIRLGEQGIEDTDEKQGRDKSLGASLDYGFRHAFKDDELPIIALLHLFQGTVDVVVLQAMGKVGDYALPELQGRTKEHLTSLLDRARDIGLLTHLRGTWFTIHPALPWFLRQLFARHYDGQAGRSASQTALRAWVEAIGALGGYYHDRFCAGNTRVIGLLSLEEANLLHARRLARRNQWWSPAISCMQGLDEALRLPGPDAGMGQAGRGNQARLLHPRRRAHPRP